LIHIHLFSSPPVGLDPSIILKIAQRRLSDDKSCAHCPVTAVWISRVFRRRSYAVLRGLARMAQVSSSDGIYAAQLWSQRPGPDAHAPGGLSVEVQFALCSVNRMSRRQADFNESKRENSRHAAAQRAATSFDGMRSQARRDQKSRTNRSQSALLDIRSDCGPFKVIAARSTLTPYPYRTTIALSKSCLATGQRASRALGSCYFFKLIAVQLTRPSKSAPCLDHSRVLGKHRGI